MFTRPEDLDEQQLRSALAGQWSFSTAVLRYLPVGFGSHHWLAADASDNRLFVTVDDLDAKLSWGADTRDAAFAQQARAFAAALSLRDDCGLRFVVAPVPSRDGQLLVRVQDRYSMVVHPYLQGKQAGDGETSEFQAARDLPDLLGLLVQLHSARPTDKPMTDHLAMPLRAELSAALSDTGQAWDSGPYAERARSLLAEHAGDLTTLMAAFDVLAARVAGRADRMVVTHGEPGAHNVIRTPAGLMLVDWDTVLLAAPERDLWDLAEHDASVLDAYSAATGIVVNENALAFYRMWYDFSEIGGYIDLFRHRHGDTADAAESWRNLQHFLQPAARWPEVFAAVVHEP